ncbi:MAG TPA: hypothetical protein VIQ60_08715, partial [Gemmatimonadaceae bacterium]
MAHGSTPYSASPHRRVFWEPHGEYLQARLHTHLPSPRPMRTTQGSLPQSLLTAIVALALTVVAAS